MNFQTTGKFVFAFVRLILGNARVNEFIGPTQEIETRQENDFELILKPLGCR